MLSYEGWRASERPAPAPEAFFCAWWSAQLVVRSAFFFPFNLVIFFFFFVSPHPPPRRPPSHRRQSLSSALSLHCRCRYCPLPRHPTPSYRRRYTTAHTVSPFSIASATSARCSV